MLTRRRLLRALGRTALTVAAPAVVRAQSILLPNKERGLYFPSGPAVVNRTHPLAFGLCFLYSPAVTPLHDLLSGIFRSGLVTSATAPAVRGTAAGQALFFGNSTANADCLKWPVGFNPIIGTGDFSMAVVANPPATASNCFLFSQSNTVTNAEAYLCANQTAGGSSTAGAFNFLTDDNSNFTDVGISSGGPDGKPHVFAGTRLGTTLTLYIDGEQAAQASGTLRNFATSNNVIVGNVTSNGVQGNGANCGIIAAAAWNRALSADEALEFGTNPSCLLTYVDDDIAATLVGIKQSIGSPRGIFIPRPHNLGPTCPGAWSLCRNPP